MERRQLKQIFAIVALPTLLSLGLLIVLLRGSLQDWAIERWSNDQRSFVNALAHGIDADIENAADLLRIAAASEAFAALPERRRIDRRLNGLPEHLDAGKRQVLERLRTEGGFSVVFVLTPEGDHYISHPFAVQRSLKKYNLADRPYFQQARTTKALVISDSFVGADGVPAVAIDLPILGAQGEIVMHLGGVLHLKQLAERLAPANIEPFEFAALIDRQNRRIAESDTGRLARAPADPLLSHPDLGPRLSGQAPKQPMPSGVNRVRFADADSRHWFSYGTELNSGWRLYLFRREAALEEIIAPQVRRITGFAAAVVLLPGLIGLWVAQRFRRRWLEATRRLHEANTTLERRIAERTAELQRSETRHRTLFETSADAILILDGDRFVDCNPAAVRVFGATSRDELLDRHPWDLSPPSQPEIGDSRTAAEAGLRKVLAEGFNDFEWTHRRLDTGEDFIARVQLSRMEIDGRVLIQASVRDITDRVRLLTQIANRKAHLEELVAERTRELTQALASAKVAEETKDAFLANMSHELRTPLNAVVGMADLALGRCTDEKLKEYLEKIERAGRHLNRIIDDLLDLSKISAGKMEIEAIPFQCRHLLRSVIGVMEHRARDKRLELVGVVDEAVPDALVGDPLRIEQILLNLIGNAVKFTHHGRIEIRVGLENAGDDGLRLRIAVSDTGIGIRAADLANLFQPFAQADTSMTRKFGGTGLGLHICRRLAELMGGDIEVRSQPGTGSTFVVRLTVARGDPDAVAAGVPAAATATLVRYENARVLVAEDQPLNREIMEALLGEVGIASVMAENGQVALDILSACGPQDFDLVLMDIQMPIVDGLAATRALRAMPAFATFPVIAVTAHTMKHEVDAALAAGMNDHIAKPYDKSRLYQVLSRWIPAAKQRTAPETPPASAAPPVQPAAHDGSAAAPGQPAFPDLDAENALRRFGGREDRYRHWLMEFADTAEGISGEIRAAVATGQTEAAVKLLHAFKGRAGMLGMEALRIETQTLETALRGDETPADQLEVWSRAVGAMCTQLRRHYGMPAAASSAALPALVWSDDYSIGIPTLDAQHRKLFDLTAKFAASLGAATGVAAQRDHEVLAELFDYVAGHFRDEEAYMRQIGFPDLPGHIDRHREFAEKMDTMRIAAIDGTFDAAEIYRYLAEWLSRHILGEDRRIGTFARERR